MASPDLPVTFEDLQTLVPSVTSNQAVIFIDTADAIIQAKGIPQAYPARVAYLIELYLAAHFSSLSLPSGVGGNAVTGVRVGNSEEQYADPTEMLSGISSTKWGLQASALDTLGLLSELSAKPVKARFTVYSDSDYKSGC